MATPSFFARGNTPTITDSRWFILQRIIGATIDNGSGGGGGGVGLVGVVDPEGTVTAPVGTPYANTVNKSFWYKESGAGNTGWQQYV